MAQYSPLQLEESFTDEEVAPQSAPRSWRRFGMVAAALGAAVGTAGAIFGVTRPKSLTTLQKMQQVAHVSHSFMQAVVARALQEDDEDISMDVGMIFAPADLEAFEGVSAEVSLRQAEEQGAKPHVAVTFQAKAEQGEALANQFRTILDGAKEHSKDRKDVPQGLFDMLDVSQDEEDSDKVRITATQPHEPDFGEEDAQKLEEGLAAKPTLKFMLRTGRSFQEMEDNIGGCLATIHGGINITASTKLATALAEGLNGVAGTELHDMMGYHRRHADKMVRKIKALEALSFVSSHSDIRYNTASLDGAVCDAEESKRHKQFVDYVKAVVPHLLVPMVGEETVKAAAGLIEYADHLHSIRLAGGLPKDYEVYMEFENFHLIPVIAEFLQVPEKE